MFTAFRDSVVPTYHLYLFGRRAEVRVHLPKSCLLLPCDLGSRGQPRTEGIVFNLCLYRSIAQQHPRGERHDVRW